MVCLPLDVGGLDIKPNRFINESLIFHLGWNRKVKNSQEGVDGSKRRKIGGELRHTVHNLKKVTRLSTKKIEMLFYVL